MSLVPPPGMLNFFQLRLPRVSRARGAEELGVVVDEKREKLPGMLAVMDPGKGPGMHRTPTLDLMTVSSSRVVLTLDDGSATELAPGDCIVQRGSMHAWASPFNEPCTITGVMLPRYK